MASLNRAELIGRLGKDPEKSVMQNGKPVVNFSIATSETWKKDGQKQEKTHWHNCVCFSEPLCKIIMDYVKKGSLVYLSGSIETRSWESNGEKKYTTEIVLRPYRGELTMLDSKPTGDYQENQDGGYNENQPAPHDGGMDDEIPFVRLMDDQF